MRYYFLTLTVLATVLAASMPALAQEKCSIKVGVVPQFEQRKLLSIWSPILEALQQKTQCSYELVGSGSISEFESKFEAGEYDLAYMNPYHAVMAHNAEGYIPIARSGEKKLQGILVVRDDSPIQDIKALDGKEIAFPSPNALGASLLMRAELATKHGLKIKSRYVKTHSSVYLHVIKKLTDAGGGVARTLKEQSPAIQEKLRILYETQKVNSHPLVIHPRIAQPLRMEIQKAFLAIGNESPQMVEQIPMTNPIATSFEDYQDLKDMGLEAFKG